MKIPQKTIPLLIILLLVASFLLGRFQGQVELLRQGKTGETLSAQTGTGGGQNPQAPAQQPPPGGTEEVVLSDEQWKSVASEPAAEKGSRDAKVTIVEFSDYQCPFCARYISETFPQINEEYIDTGKVRYMLRDLPLPFHSNANVSAQAARCAGDQGKYWEMHDVLFEKQDEWSSGDPKETFAKYAGDLGLNTSSFSGCLSDEKYKEEVDRDGSLAQGLGVRGTPGFFINGKLLIGAQPFSAFEQVIEAEL